MLYGSRRERERQMEEKIMVIMDKDRGGGIG